jgi:hypothetical protein
MEQRPSEASRETCLQGEGPNVKRDEYFEQFERRAEKADFPGKGIWRESEGGEAVGNFPEGRAVSGARRRKVQRRNHCARFDEPPDADPHVRWCGRGVAARFKNLKMDEEKFYPEWAILF